METALRVPHIWIEYDVSKHFNSNAFTKLWTWTYESRVCVCGMEAYTFAIYKRMNLITVKASFVVVGIGISSFFDHFLWNTNSTYTNVLYMHFAADMKCIYKRQAFNRNEISLLCAHTFFHCTRLMIIQMKNKKDYLLLDIPTWFFFSKNLISLVCKLIEFNSSSSRIYT